MVGHKGPLRLGWEPSWLGYIPWCAAEKDEVDRWSTKRGENHANCRTTPVWEAKEVKSKVVKAYLGIFADDILVVGEHGVLTQVMQDLQRVFYMSPYDVWGGHGGAQGAVLWLENREEEWGVHDASREVCGWVATVTSGSRSRESSAS